MFPVKNGLSKANQKGSLDPQVCPSVYSSPRRHLNPKMNGESLPSFVRPVPSRVNVRRGTLPVCG